MHTRVKLRAVQFDSQEIPQLTHSLSLSPIWFTAIVSLTLSLSLSRHFCTGNIVLVPVTKFATLASQMDDVTGSGG